jgi:NAD(P)H-flavin reductase
VRRAVRVTANERLGAYNLLRVADPMMDGVGAGQFAMLAALDGWGGGEDERPFLARAFSIARYAQGEAAYLLEDVGPGTRRLCELTAGDELWVLGPLGRGFSVPPQERRAILVGGGVGIAPLAILQNELEARGAAETTVLLGFRDEARVAGAQLLPGARLATDDGSAGHAGLVTELLEQELSGGAHVAVYACGPAGMLEGVRAICERAAVPAQLALEAPMACGFGACYGCAVPKRGGGYLRVCVDGPVIEAAALDRVEAHAGAPA